MYASTIRFILPEGTDWDSIREQTRERAQLYADMPGLRSKAFVFDPKTGEYGGNYVWDTREALDSFLQSDMFRNSASKFGQPEIRIYEVGAYLDQGKVIAPEASTA